LKFLADEGVERAIVDLLRADGHDVAYVAEGAGGLDDDSVSAWPTPSPGSSSRTTRTSVS
jgi:hypothetical protein